MIETMTNQDMLSFVMPFGKHKNKPLGSVPCGYLAWLYEEGTATGLLSQILDHFEVEILSAATEGDEELPLKMVVPE